VSISVAQSLGADGGLLGRTGVSFGRRWEIQAQAAKPVKLTLMGAIKRFILWDFPRGSWQYDVMVGLILAFIFVTPKTIFHDQPKAASVAILRNGFWIDPQVLSGVAEADMLKKASAAVNAKYKTHTTIVNVDPIFNDEQELQGYMAYTKP
jgi:hypothetical protein